MAMSQAVFTNPLFVNIRFREGDWVDLKYVRSAIQEETDKNGIAVAFREDQVKVGGLFSSEREDVLVMYNPQHSTDYTRFVVRLTHQGKYAFLRIYDLGTSKNISNTNAAASGSLFKKMANAVSGVNQKLQVEYQYYNVLEDSINTAFDAH